MSTTTSARLRAAHHGVALQDHHLERHRHGGLQPVHHHAERVADQDDVAIAVDQARGMGVIGGQAHDRLAALAGADVGRGEPLDLLAGPTWSATSEHRHADDVGMEPEAEREIEKRADDDRNDVVARARRAGSAAPPDRCGA